MWILPKQLHTLAYVPDTAALSLDLNESSQLCAQSLFVRSKPLPLRTWLQKWKRDLWTQHLYGRILRPSHGKSFEIRWTFFLEATPASHSVQPGSDLEQTTQDIFGPTSQAAFDFFDQSFVFLKTSKDTLPLDSEKSLENWKNLVTKRRGEYSQRLNVARLTSESACSSLPTASTRDHKGGYEGGRIRGGKISMDTLYVAVQAYTDGGLAAQGNHSTNGSRQESWATPRTKDAKSWMMNQARLADGKPEDTLTGQALNSNKNNGKLNPRWVETLMGLPVGWVMPSCTHPIASPATVVTESYAGSAENTTESAHALGQIATMTDSRVDELCLLGNGAVLATAALAFRTLLDEIPFSVHH
jgi:hypothetical protein